jgi:hypothetical protein
MIDCPAGVVSATIKKIWFQTRNPSILVSRDLPCRTRADTNGTSHDRKHVAYEPGGDGCVAGARRLRSGSAYTPGLEMISAPKSDLAVGNFTRTRQRRNLDSAPGELNQIFDELKIFDQVLTQ